MPDIFSKEKRSEIMALIKPKGTKPELLVFKELRKRKIYFQKHYKKVPGSPDIALPKRKIAVLIDGDFWHGYRFDHVKHRLPKEYWLEKIKANIRRDKRNRRLLRDAGWRVMRIWEHELKKKKFEKTMDRIVAFLRDNN